MKWQVDPEGLEKAKELLGLTLPVRIRALSTETSSYSFTGKYHGLGRWGVTTEERLAIPCHHISLSGSMSAYSANDVCWHEMTHGAQTEDYLPEEGEDGLEPYQIANREMRKQFGRELREGLARSSYDTFFEEDARYWQKNSDAVKILIPTPTELELAASKKKKDKKGKEDPTEERELPEEDSRPTWRVDMWTADMNPKHRDFVGTTYVIADKEYDAKKWARDHYMDGVFSSNIEAYEIDPDSLKL